MGSRAISVPNWKDRYWFSPQGYPLNKSIADWLLEEESMTRRCECYCREVTVQPQFEGYVSAESLAGEASELPVDQRYWVREILLFGDNIPWLWARTVVPEFTLSGPELSLKTLGTTPLGRYLYAQPALERDYIQISLLDSLWGRRSRLRLSGKPLLLTEIFLPSAPLY
ncbi:chorismate lyase [Budvicia diplopodorum]|uniref:chorismate lyase n=1 Tax=Budvicia diplopodorum TaxID=1119056 RepID=UPI00135BB8AB|nr:chorismate lyase [Budvicia diplopodorum]